MFLKKIIREALFVLLILGAAYYYFAVYPKQMVRERMQTLEESGSGGDAGQAPEKLPKEP